MWRSAMGPKLYISTHQLGRAAGDVVILMPVRGDNRLDYAKKRNRGNFVTQRRWLHIFTRAKVWVMVQVDYCMHTTPPRSVEDIQLIPPPYNSVFAVRWKILVHRDSRSTLLLRGSCRPVCLCNGNKHIPYVTRDTIPPGPIFVVTG